MIITSSCNYTNTCLSAVPTESSSSSSKRPHTTALDNEASITPTTTYPQKRRRAGKPPATTNQEEIHGKAVGKDKSPSDKTLTGTTQSDTGPPQINLEQIPLDDDNSLIDPVLLRKGAMLAGVIAGATVDTLTEAAEDELFYRITNPDRDTAPSIGSLQQVMSLNPLDYTRFLSATNLLVPFGRRGC